MKKIILSLLVGFVGIISFCNSVNLSVDGNTLNSFHLTSSSYSTAYDFPHNYMFFLYNYSDMSSNGVQVKCGGGTLNCQYSPTSYVNAVYKGDIPNLVNNLITTTGTCYNNCTITVFGSSTIDVLLFNPDGGSCPACPECPSCPEVNTGEILSGYILESSIDENYCVSNDLCPVNSGDSASWSELVINDIVHQSAPLININIPQEFDWSYTVNENEFDLGISGYNVDTDYIDGIITTQNAKPSTEDFNKIITGLIPLFVPGLVIILFLRFVFKFIKKIF